MSKRLLDFSELRVYIEEETHPIYEKLVSQANKQAEEKPFMTMKDLFLVAACVGQKEGVYKPTQVRREIFRGSVFRERIDAPMLAVLAYQRTQSLDTLTDSGQVLETVQGWANGGIGLVQDTVLNQSGRPLANLVDMVLGES